jgi:predicted HAD superfamily Cof-like phosphohydrolase
MSVDQIELWHKRARPNPTDDDFNVQLGCHFEEIVEMMDTLLYQTDKSPELHKLVADTYEGLANLADVLKSGKLNIDIANGKEFLDSLADQIVTAVGVGYCAGMKTADAVAAVNRSNYSKFDKNGYPIFNENGKIAKGPDYEPPDLEGMY